MSAFGEQCDRCAVIDHESHALARIVRIERDIGAAGLEDAKQGDDQCRTAVHAHGHPVIGADPQCDQVMGELVGPAIELPVAQGLVLADQGDRRGLFERPALEQAMDRLPRIVGGGIVELLEKQATLCRWQDIELPDRTLGCRLQRLHDRLGRPCHQGHQLLRIHSGNTLRRDSEVFTEIIDRQRDRIVRALLARQHAHARPTRLRRIGIGVVRVAVAIIEQRREQRHRRRNTTGALRQRQRRLLVLEQIAETPIGLG